MLVLEAGQLLYTTVTSLTPKPDVTRVNIIVGNSDTDTSLGGNAPYVALYDNGGKLMGIHEPGNRNKIWDQGKTSKQIKDGLSRELDPLTPKPPASRTLTTISFDSMLVWILIG